MMHEKGISSCTTNMKWDERRLWTVSWAVIPALSLPEPVAPGYLPDLSGSCSTGRIPVPIPESEAENVLGEVLISFSFLCQLSSLPGEGEE